MKENKNIDRLFQEKFKNFERHPDREVWDNILAAQKEKKEDRKVVPLWWRLAGAAATLLLLVSTGILFNTNNTSGAKDGVVTTTQTNDASSDLRNTINDTDDTQTQATQNQEVSVAITSETNKNVVPKSVTKNKATQEQNTITPSVTNRIVSTQRPSTIFNDNIPKKTDDNAGYPITVPNKVNELETYSSSSKKIENKKSAPVENALVNQEKTNTVDAIEDNPNDNTTGISLVEVAQNIQDSNQEDDEIVVPNVLEGNRWDVAARAAPVYYGDFGGSGIDPQFNDNAKTGDVNLSYGVQLSYAVSPKVKIRAGVNNVNLSYNTQDIEFTAGLGARQITGINYSQNAQSLNITDRNSSNSQTDELIENNPFTRTINGSLEQRLGFIEVPLEAVYVISNKRLGVEFVGGLSTLFLNNNEILLNAEDGLQNNLGTANGINELSFTTNIGLGLNYKMTEKFKLNVEPSFKYQLNAFGQSASEFRPYFIGLYTGVSYRF